MAQNHMTNDNIYWLFSAAAQSISAFVAFLLTGYALVHTLMEAAREKDDTLEEIHAALSKKYHRRLFHGHVDHADEEMLRRTQQAASRIEKPD